MSYIFGPSGAINMQRTSGSGRESSSAGSTKYSMTFKRGDRVRDEAGGPAMEVLASSDQLTLCSYDEHGFSRQAVFETRHLRKVVVQQAEQPQPFVDEQDQPASSYD